MKTITVIIPMYNAEAFIGQCIQSVLVQTYPCFEILVIDDASTDRGPEICEKMAAKDDRIFLFRREKKGVSAARNFGLGLAKGEYIFFLDSDDAIHPLLFEEMVRQMEKYKAEMAFCVKAYIDSVHMDDILQKISYKDKSIGWQMAEGLKIEEMFHNGNYGMAGIGGKMFRAGCISNLRFDETLINGEDTLFIYQLICEKFEKIRLVFSLQKWYYYRMHEESVTHLDETVRNENYYMCVKTIRDMEYRKGRIHFALIWELRTINKMEKRYVAFKRMGKVEICRQIRETAKIEKKHPLYQYVPLAERMLFTNCFSCRFLFHVQRRLMYICRTIKQKMGLVGPE